MRQAALALLAVVALVIACPLVATAENATVTGVIIGFECGESPFLIVRDANGKTHSAVCYQNWCEQAAREEKWCPGSGSGNDRLSRQYLGKTIKGTLRLIMIEEPVEPHGGVYANEFENIEFLGKHAGNGMPSFPKNGLRRGPRKFNGLGMAPSTSITYFLRRGSLRPI